MKPRRYQPEYSSPLRAMARLLVAVLIVAPLWHVCALGGGHCAPRHSSTLSCHDPSVEAGFDVASAVPAPFTGTCLARLLMAMPGGLPAPTLLVVPSASKSTLAALVPLAPPALFAPRPPARNPPFFVI